MLNPFAVLNLSPDARRGDIAAAYDDALADGVATEDALKDARRDLLVPKARLLATIEFLPDAQPGDREECISLLRRAAPLSDLIAFARKLPSFGRTLFLSQLAHVKTSPGLLRYFAMSRAEVDAEAICEAVAATLDRSGSPRPHRDAVVEAIELATQQAADRLFTSYGDATASAQDLTQCLEEALPQASESQVAALSTLVSAYSRSNAGSLQLARRKVEDSVNAVRDRPDLPAGAALIRETLVAWDKLAQPQQLLANHKGRDDGSARDLFQFLRGLMLELANDRGKPALSLEINKICSSVFAELPRASQQLEEDQQALIDLADQELLLELTQFVVHAKKDLDPLVRDLTRNGFGATALGAAKTLYDLLGDAVSRAEGSRVQDVPWQFVRGLALDINNDLGESEASRRLIEGLFNHPRFGDASQKMQSAIGSDLKTVNSNVLHSKLNRAVQQKDRSQARNLLAQLMSMTTDPSERQQYQQTINEMKAADQGRIVKWVIWAVIVLAIIGYSVSQNGRSSTTYRPSPSVSSPAPTTTSPEAETMPAVGKNRTLTRANLRYCMFENVRLDAAKAMLAVETNERVVTAFNRRVDDFNSRCGSYQYYDNDLNAVENELRTQRSNLNAQGRSLVLSWRTPS